MSDDVAIIERFVQLTWKQRTEALAESQSLELQRLGEHLKHALAGAATGPRAVGPGVTVGGSPAVGANTRADGRRPADPQRATPRAEPSSAARATPTPSAPRVAPAPSTSPAPPARPASSAPSSPSAPDPTSPGPVSVSDVQLPDDSAYTPSQRPVFARDYFGEDADALETTPDLEPVAVPREAPPAADPSHPAVVASEPPDPPAEAAPPEVLVPDAPTSPPEPAAAERSSAARRSRRRGRSALVYLSDGTSIRGSARDWDPSGDVLELRTKEGARRVSIDEILVAFMGPAPGGPPEADAEAEGRRVKVELTNGKRLVGVTADYEAGRDRFTLRPDAKSSGVERVWIPASSVDAIHRA